MQSYISLKKRRWNVLATRAWLGIFPVLSFHAAPVGAATKVAYSAQSFKEPSSPLEKLEGMIIAVNSQARFVPAGSTVNFVRGDVLEVREALLKDRRKQVEKVKVIGFTQSLRAASDDDRGTLIDTNQYLNNPALAANPQEELYAVIANSRALLYGRIFLHPIAAQLHYVEVSINGALRVLRPGERLELKSDDLFKITRIASNINEASAVQFNIVARSENSKNAQTSIVAKTWHSLVFSHQGYVFCEIPMSIEIR
jgi:hypothetical protein